MDHTTDARPHLIGVWGDEGERNLIGGTDTATLDNDDASGLSYEDDLLEGGWKSGNGRPGGAAVGVNGSDHRGGLEVDRDDLKLPTGVSESDGWQPL